MQEAYLESFGKEPNMSFEKSPSFDDLEKRKPEKKNPFPHWLLRVLLIAVAVLGSGILLFSGVKLGARASVPPGGLDGCLVNAAGNPIVAEMSFGDQSTESFEDGCFFFYELAAGNSELIVRHGGEDRVFPIEIISGRAVTLGEMVIE
jgi:hypothetical protein